MKGLRGAKWKVEEVVLVVKDEQEEWKRFSQV